MARRTKEIESLVRASISPIGAAASAIVATATILVAARNSQLEALAGYAAGLSIGGLTALALGGGTTLKFAISDLEIQAAVRRVRTNLIIPAIGLISVIGAFVYSHITHLSILSLMMGGIAASANNLSEIEVAYLRRNLRTIAVLVGDIFGKLLGLTIVLLHGQVALALAIGALVRVAALSWLSRDDESRRFPIPQGVAPSMRLAYDRHLMSSAFLYGIIDRAPFLVMPAVVPPQLAGTFSTALTIQQSAAGVLVSGAQTTVAQHRSPGGPPTWARIFESILLAGSVLFTLIAIFASKRVLPVLGINGLQELPLAWTAIWLSLPVAVGNRLLQLRQVAQGRGRSVMLTLMVASATMLLAAMSGILFAHYVPVAWSPLFAETAGLLFFIVAKVKSK